jgi:hypothetical protein
MGISVIGALAASFLSDALTGAAPMPITKAARTNDFITFIVYLLLSMKPIRSARHASESISGLT